MVLMLCSAAAVAAETAQPVGYWGALKVRIEKVTPRKKNSAHTAVGGVRSAKQDDAELYWKGRDAALEADEDELTVFKQALRLASNGQRGESIKLFEGFLATYPQSQLKDDCLKALEQLKVE